MARKEEFFGMNLVKPKGTKVYQWKKIEFLAKEYINTIDNKVFERLIVALTPMIDVQLGKNYSSLKEYWDDMKQEVFLKLWKNKSSFAFTKTKSYCIYFYQRIRGDLNRAAKRMKKDYMLKLPEAYFRMIEETEGGYHIDFKDTIDNIEELTEYNRDD